jgi:hypothetical protein
MLRSFQLPGCVQIPSKLIQAGTEILRLRLKYYVLRSINSLIPFGIRKNAGSVEGVY